MASDPTDPRGRHNRTFALSDGEEAEVVEAGISDRYDLRGELGRGGLGKVLAAVDRTLGREVAIKLTLSRSGTGIARFLREGQVAGRLMHPNIVPVFDVGSIEHEGAVVPFFAMGRIEGRDLAGILADLARGEPATVLRFGRQRLLQIFQDVCQAVAYAHDHGVIHRDLKPANVMVGHYGEVFVVDWGLAKVRDEDDLPRHQAAPATEAALTLDGQVLGTPAYMPPEQAAGQIDAVDERSDVYALGAILYELLTGVPPHEGDSVAELLDRVLSGEILAPSRRSADSEGRVAPGGPFAVPELLDEVVLKALARDPDDRYASAGELAEAVRAFLEGQKDRERAEAMIREADAAIQRRDRALSELETVDRERKAVKAEVLAHWPAEKKQALWDLEDRVEELRREAFAGDENAVIRLQEALGFVRDHAGARTRLAHLFWDRFVEAEARADVAGMVQAERRVRQYNDGAFDARLKGDGSVSVRTRAFPCACLREGRLVAPDELDLLGYHPMSGRDLEGTPKLEGLVDLEPEEPVRLRTHGPECRTEPLDGAEVWLVRLEERGRRMLPVDGPDGLPEDLVASLYPGPSPYRPSTGRYLGPVPTAPVDLAMGAYVLLVRAPGRRPVRVPVAIGRLARIEVELTLYAPDEIPEGFVQVPAGPTPLQGDPDNPNAAPRWVFDIDDVFVSRHPVTCAEYLAFLNDLPADEGRARVPRESERTGLYWVREGDRWVLPDAEWVQRNAPDDPKATRLTHGNADWEPDWPVFSVSWEDAMHYAAWVRAEQGTLVTLPNEWVWERAARGPEGRFYPWGNREDSSFCNMNQSWAEGSQPCSVHAFPSDESPYGVRGMCGNSKDLCLDPPGRHYPGWRCTRGGWWAGAALEIRSSYRSGTYPSLVDDDWGIRLVLHPRSKLVARPGEQGRRPA